MFIMTRKKTRKTDRSRTNRFRAKLKAKNKKRRARIYCAYRALNRRTSSRWRRCPG